MNTTTSTTDFSYVMSVIAQRVLHARQERNEAKEAVLKAVEAGRYDEIPELGKLLSIKQAELDLCHRERQEAIKNN